MLSMVRALYIIVTSCTSRIADTKMPDSRTITRALAAGVVTAFAAGAAWSQGDAPEVLERGEAVYTHWCAPCHAAGPGMPGTQALQVKYDGDPPAVLTERSDLTPELISVFVRTGVSVMPFFRKTEISDADLEALAAYVVATAGEEG